MKYIKPLIPLAYLAVLLTAFVLAMSTARDNMNERVDECYRLARLWMTSGPSDAVMMCAAYGENWRDVWTQGGAW